MERPLVILSDAHLGHRPSAAVARDLARLVDQHAGHEIVLNGDTFNLSWDRPGVDPAASVAAMLAPHRDLRRSLAAHVRDGGALTLLAGNHDADVQRPDVRMALVSAIGCPADVPVRVEPWFIRRGAVHIEHGHVHDPDNAPTHPLAPPHRRSEPVGVAIVRRFVAAHPEVALLDREEATPLENLGDALARLRLRAPAFVLRYCAVLVGINLETAVRSRLQAERRLGAEAVDAHARRTGVPPATVDALLKARPVPTHTRFGDTFMRLYFDRIAAALAVGGGVVVAGLASPLVGAGIVAPAATYLMVSSRRRNRYANRMADGLAVGARTVRQLTRVELVCFGHTHEEADIDGYMNSGAFGDPPAGGRPFILVDATGRAERRRLLEP